MIFCKQKDKYKDEIKNEYSLTHQSYMLNHNLPISVSVYFLCK